MDEAYKACLDILIEEETPAGKRAVIRGDRHVPPSAVEGQDIVAGEDRPVCPLIPPLIRLPAPGNNAAADVHASTLERDHNTGLVRVSV